MDELFTCAFDSLAPSESGGTADQGINDLVSRVLVAQFFQLGKD